MTNESLLIKYRPNTLDEVLGNKEVKKIIKSWGKEIPHCIMLTGPSGTGKTTLARIIANILDKPYIEESDATIHGGKEDAKNLVGNLHTSPIGYSNRIKIIDEAHRLTTAAQSLLLKPTEDCKDFNYFIFCTTDPKDIMTTLKGRCITLDTTFLDVNETAELLDRVYCAEKGIDEDDCPFDEKFIIKLFEATDGSAREILGNLKKVIGLSPDEIKTEMFTIIEEDKANKDLVTKLLSSSFNQIAPIIKALPKGEVEGVRQGCLAYTTAVVLNRAMNKGEEPSKRALAILKYFEKDFFSNGKAGLTQACYKVCKEG